MPFYLMDKPISEFGLTEWVKIAVGVAGAAALTGVMCVMFLATSPILAGIALVQTWKRL